MDQYSYSIIFLGYQFSSGQSLSHVWLFATPRTAACQASQSITNSRSLLKLMFIESVMPSSHLILCCPLLLLSSIFSSIRVFQMSQFFTSGGQSIGASTSTSVLPMNIQGWFPLRFPCSCHYLALHRYLVCRGLSILVNEVIILPAPFRAHL